MSVRVGLVLAIGIGLALAQFVNPALAGDEAVLKPRVPIGMIEEARTWMNPLPASEENIEKGQALFHGKAFCVTCHGQRLGGYSGPRRKTSARFH